MRIGVLGTGIVGRTLASKLVSLGDEVMMGSRQAGNEAAAAWAEEAGQLADQRTFPETRVVKSLNTVNADVMVEPGIVPGSHTVFVAGDDAGAKDTVKEILTAFGWPAEDVMDLGGIQAARGLEMFLPLWLGLCAARGTSHINVKVVAP